MTDSHASYALTRRPMQDAHLRNHNSWSRTRLKQKDFKVTKANNITLNLVSFPYVINLLCKARVCFQQNQKVH